MNNYSNEKMSAWIDGEDDGKYKHDDEECNYIVDRLISDEQLKSTWFRYHLIGDCLRSHLPKIIANDIAENVSKALDDEATILAPQKRTPQKRSIINMKSLAGFAIAASVALVAVLVVQTGKNVATDSEIPVAVNNAVDNSPVTFTFSRPEVSQALPATVKKSDPLQLIENQRFNHYLMNHNEYRSNGSINGILPYVRMVTIESQE